ncbi:hypothetical protein STEG23_006043, partial [Scotinomys teguina]
MGIPKDGLQNLANTLEGDKDLNSPRELSAEAEKELAIEEKTIHEAHVDRVNPELKCILVILPSRHFPTGILMQRKDVILEWIFLPCKPNKKLKTYIEKISDLIHKEYENLWIVSRLIWFDQTRAPEKFSRCSSIQNSFKATGLEDTASQIAPVRIKRVNLSAKIKALEKPVKMNYSKMQTQTEELK